MLAQRLALEIGHHQVEQPVGSLTQSEDGTDVGMVQPGGDGRLSPEALDRGRIARELGDQDLDRDGPLGTDLEGLIYVRHPTLAQLTGDAITLVQNLTGE